MQPVCAVKALKKETIMDSNTIGLPAVITGPKGLRAGWRLLIFLLMLVAMGAVARAIIIRFLIPAGFAHEKFSPSSVAVPDAFFVFIVTVAAWVMQNRRTQDRSVWPTLETRTDEAPVVGSMDRLSRQQRNRANHLPAAWASDREPYDSWHDDSDVGGCLGRGIPVISHSGGVSVSRVCAVHADDRHRFLARSSGALSSLRVESP